MNKELRITIMKTYSKEYKIDGYFMLLNTNLMFISLN